jgi:hypothetical protein
LNGSFFVIAAGLVVSLCPRSHRWLATALASYFLLTAGILLVLGQPATFAISSVVVASCLFLRGRLLPLGALLFMLSLAVKPQIGGLIVLYFLVQRVAWRHAVVALAGALALLLSASLIMRVRPATADWPSTLRSNLSATLSPGGSADPRPDNQQSVGDVNLQTVTSIFSPRAQAFNLLAYTSFLALLAVGIAAVVQAGKVMEVHLLALGALSILSLTPVYHRFYDTRLLLLSVPAVVVVFQKRRPLGLVIAVLTVVATVSVQYRVQAFLLAHAQWQNVLHRKIWFIFLLRQQNLELLLLYCLYVLAMFSIRSPSTAEVGSFATFEPAAVQE